MRRPGGGLRRPPPEGEEGAAAAVGTVLLVVITVAMVVVVGMFVFAIVRMPENPPDIRVNYSKLNQRWTISVADTSEEVPISSMRLLARNASDDFVTYDSDGDAVPDATMVTSLEDLVVSTGDGPQPAPIAYIDTDTDGRVGVGDFIVVYELFIPVSSPLMDADRGYRLVGPNPDGIPRDSTLYMVASPSTLGNNDIGPGDGVRVELRRGATLVHTVEGNASAGGIYTQDVYIPPGWSTGAYSATFIIRPGELDEWTQTHAFQVDPAAFITPAQRAAFDDTNHPFEMGDTVMLVHKPSNSVVLKFSL